MKETLADLNSLLFEELERLGNEDLTDAALQQELQRSQAISCIAKNIVNNAELIFRAAKFKDERMDANTIVPALLGANDG